MEFCFDQLTNRQQEELEMLYNRAKYGERFYVKFLDRVSENNIPFFTLSTRRFRWEFEKIVKKEYSKKEKETQKETGPEIFNFMKNFGILEEGFKQYLESSNDEIQKYIVTDFPCFLEVKSQKTGETYKIKFIPKSQKILEDGIVKGMSENLHFIVKEELKKESVQEEDIEIFVVQLGKLHALNFESYMYSKDFQDNANKENISYDITSFALTIESEKEHTLECYNRFVLEPLKKDEDNILNSSEFGELRKKHSPITISYENFIEQMKRINKENKEITKKDFKNFHQKNYFENEGGELGMYL